MIMDQTECFSLYTDYTTTYPILFIHYWISYPSIVALNLGISKKCIICPRTSQKLTNGTCIWSGNNSMLVFQFFKLISIHHPSVGYHDRHVNPWNSIGGQQSLHISPDIPMETCCPAWDLQVNLSALSRPVCQNISILLNPVSMHGSRKVLAKHCSSHLCKS